MKTAVFKIVNGVVTEINGQPANGQESAGKMTMMTQSHPNFSDDLRLTIRRACVFGLTVGKSIEIGDGSSVAIPITTNGEHSPNVVIPPNDNFEFMCYSLNGATCTVVVDYTAERFNY